MLALSAVERVLPQPPPGEPSSRPPALPRPPRATVPPPAARTPGQVATSMYGQPPRGGLGVSWSRLQGRAILLPRSVLCPPFTEEKAGAEQGGGSTHSPASSARARFPAVCGEPGLLGGAWPGGGLLHSNGGRSGARAAAFLLEPVPPAP